MTQRTMRTFIAIDLSDEIKRELSNLQAELKKTNADVKWVDPENIHLTLKFLGEITEQQAAQVKDALNKIALQFKPFEISLAGIGAFPKLDYPRVIWVGIEKGKGETKQIADKIEEELNKLGFQKKDREFNAHLTIGRVRSPKNKQALKEKVLSLEHRTWNIEPQLISHLTFYQSALSPRGSTYTCLYEAPLK